MSEITVHGNCHCKKIRFTAAVNPSAVRICHCNDCQILSGSAFRVSLPVVSEKFKLICGALKTYVKIAESGNKRAQCFCENCGTQIYATDLDEQSILNLRVGTIDERKILVPQNEKFTSEKMPWLIDSELVN
ncbi:MAG: GFA family protein [Kangiellaceae bacterium]|nr:GFA family protein [Kangiellaceae bacterium]MCW8998561.1 GFA family protein [Kangiellaceae bacterium]MCW9017688.1 GFA family protein [Kangiellaceae bacterium]